MERTEIIEKLTPIFRKTFSDESLVINDDMTANDVPGWTSLTNMGMINYVESEFNIRFKLKDLNKLKRVGDLLSLIEEKLK